MSIAEQVSRIQTDRNAIRTKLNEMGLVATTANLDACADAIEGIVNRGAVSATVQEGATYTIPKGYHNGSGTVSGISGGGNYTLQSKSATPTKTQQSVTPDSGYYGLSDVTIAAIPEAYQDVSTVTATASDVLANKVIVDSTGSNIVGTMTNNGAVSKTLYGSSTSYTVPEGYHNGSGKVSIVTETKTATPSTSAQDITPSTGRVLTKVTVAAIPSAYQDVSNVTATASDMKSGVVAVAADGTEITGTMTVNSPTTTTLNTTTTSYTIPEGYHDGTGKVTHTLETKTVTPTKSSQNITPTSGKVLSKVTVSAIPNNYIDSTDATAAAANILEGKTAYVGGTDTSGNTIAVKITGTMASNGSASATMDGLTTTSVTIPAGYTTGGTVSLTNDIETALAAI